MRVEIRLEFNHLFRDEKKEQALVYLQKLSKKSVEEIVGFFTTHTLPDYHNFFSNPVLQEDINKRIFNYVYDNKIKGNVNLVSREGSLHLAEIIFSNKENLIDNNNNPEDRDTEELCLFKAFLVINESINKSNNLTVESTEDNIQKIAEIFVALKFPSADLGVFEDVGFELLKLGYATSFRFEKLLEFLSSKEELSYLLDDICSYFNQDNIEKLKKQVDYLIVQILRFRQNNSYKYKVEDEDSSRFLDSLCADEIVEDADFLGLRNHPLYKIDESTYSIIDPFFVLDKFTKSIKFILKESYNRRNGYLESDGRFFSWFNKDFSEEYLMKQLLDGIFAKKYFIKAKSDVGDERKPDYYVRYNNDLYVFEYKDVLFKKEVKISGNIELILDTLRKKLLFDPTDQRAVGIGQLINHIRAINEDKFIYDDKIDLTKKNSVFPVLLLSDRLLEIPGINFILNVWFRENLQGNLGKLAVKDLCVLDIDTLILLESYLKIKDRNFKDLLTSHINKMNMDYKGYGSTLKEFEENFIRKVSEKLNPFAGRISSNYFNPNGFLGRFSYLVNDKL